MTVYPASVTIEAQIAIGKLWPSGVAQQIEKFTKKTKTTDHAPGSNINLFLKLL